VRGKHRASSVSESFPNSERASSQTRQRHTALRVSLCLKATWYEYVLISDEVTSADVPPDEEHNRDDSEDNQCSNQHVALDTLGNTSPLMTNEDTEGNEQKRPDQCPGVGKNRKIDIPEFCRTGGNGGQMADPRHEVANEQAPVTDPFKPRMGFFDSLWTQAHIPAISGDQAQTQVRPNR